jgi:hypothetical protein
VAETHADTTEWAKELIHTYLNGLFEGRASDVVALYAADAHIIRYEGVARERDIESFVDLLVQSRRGGSLHSIDSLVVTEDTISWDATIETSEGPIQTSDVFVVSPDGLISRHVPRLLGYWGS